MLFFKSKRHTKKSTSNSQSPALSTAEFIFFVVEYIRVTYISVHIYKHILPLNFF